MQRGFKSEPCCCCDELCKNCGKIRNQEVGNFLFRSYEAAATSELWGTQIALVCIDMTRRPDNPEECFQV